MQMTTQKDQCANIPLQVSYRCTSAAVHMDDAPSGMPEVLYRLCWCTRSVSARRHAVTIDEQEPGRSSLRRDMPTPAP